MVYLESERDIYCSKCGTKVDNGRACGKDVSIVFWYCSTCDEFLQWQVLGTAEVSEQCQESVRSFLRSLRHQADGGEPHD